MLTALEVGPQPVGPEHWLPVILGGSNDHRSSRPFHQSKVVFRNSPYDLINMKMAAVYAVDVAKFKRLYLLDDTTPFGRTQVDEFEKVAKQLGDAAQKIDAELIAAQGKPLDLGGYYRPDPKKTAAAMRPSPTLNAIIDAL